LTAFSTQAQNVTQNVKVTPLGGISLIFEDPTALASCQAARLPVRPIDGWAMLSLAPPSTLVGRKK
jgi:hypothetical protein